MSQQTVAAGRTRKGGRFKTQTIYPKHSKRHLSVKKDPLLPFLSSKHYRMLHVTGRIRWAPAFPGVPLIIETTTTTTWTPYVCRNRVPSYPGRSSEDTTAQVHCVPGMIPHRRCSRTCKATPTAGCMITAKRQRRHEATIGDLSSLSRAIREIQ